MDRGNTAPADFKIARDSENKKTNGNINAKKAEKGDWIIQTERRRETFYITNNNRTDKTMRDGAVHRKF